MLWLFILELIVLWWIISFLPPKWVPCKFLPAVAMTIAPFIFFHPDRYYLYDEQRLINHETRHIWQQRVFSPALMLILYLLFSAILFVYFVIKYRSVYFAYTKAYWYNPFEADARNHETIAGHLNQF